MTLTAFVLLILSLALTLNLYFPVLSNARFMVYSFATGWLAGELALQIALIEMLLAAVLLINGSFAILALFANWLALLHHHYQGQALGPVVESALQKALGVDYRAAINPDLRSALQLAPDFATQLRPFKRDKTGLTITRNIPYDHHDLKLDIYAADTRPASAPVLMHIHGGAWMYGDKAGQAVPLMQHMARLGWICCSVAYRLSPSATYPDHIIDCKAALSWIKANIGDYGGNADFVAVTGGSAGGHLSALLALTPNDPAFQPGFETNDTKVQAAVPFYGVFDWSNRDQLQHNSGLQSILEDRIVKQTLAAAPTLFENASPLLRITDSAPPFMVVHGDKDSLVPIGLGRVFTAELEAASNNAVVYLEVPGAQHAFDVFASPRSEHTKLGVARFLTHAYSQHLAHSGARQTS
jgi:acetyl esterase/lipase